MAVFIISSLSVLQNSFHITPVRCHHTDKNMQVVGVQTSFVIFVFFLWDMQVTSIDKSETIHQFIIYLLEKISSTGNYTTNV